MSLTNTEKQAARNAALDTIARTLGFASWAKFETAVKRGEVVITLTRTENAQ